jgi:hypothetical protein
MRITKLFLIIGTILSTSLLAWTEVSMTESRFNQIIDEVSNANRNVLLRSSPKGSVFQRDWSQDKMNGHASNINGQAQIVLKGGVARHRAMTEDGFRAYICHEVGHVAGGPPQRKTGLAIYHNLSVECQADYYATSQCLRRVFAKNDNLSIVAKMNVPANVGAKCALAHSTPEKKALCIRSAMAGFSFINSFQTQRNEAGEGQEKAIDFSTPDTSKVAATLESYPSRQCRLDTLFQGALGGERPACWYNDNLQNENIKIKIKETEVSQ